MSRSPCPVMTARPCRTWRSPTGTTAPPPAPCAPPRSGSCAPTPSAPPNSKASGPAPPSPSSTSPPGGTGSRKPARPSPAPAPRCAATPNSPTSCWRYPITPRQRELFVTEFIPMPPQGLVTDRVARNVEEARNALRLHLRVEDHRAGRRNRLRAGPGRRGVPRPRPHRPVLGDPAEPDPDPARAAQAPGTVADPRSRLGGMTTRGAPGRTSRGHPASPIESTERSTNAMNLISTSWTCQRCGGAFISTPPDSGLCDQTVSATLECACPHPGTARCARTPRPPAPQCGGPVCADCGQRAHAAHPRHCPRTRAAQPAAGGERRWRLTASRSRRCRSGSPCTWAPTNSATGSRSPSPSGTC